MPIKIWKKTHISKVWYFKVNFSKIVSNFSIARRPRRPNRQQQPKFQTLFHKNSSPRDLFKINLDVYLATSSHKNKKLKRLSLSLRHDYWLCYKNIIVYSFPAVIFFWLKYVCFGTSRKLEMASSIWDGKCKLSRLTE